MPFLFALLLLQVSWGGAFLLGLHMAATHGVSVAML